MPTAIPTFDDMLEDLINEYSENADDYYAALAEVIAALETKAADLKAEVADNAEGEESDEDDEDDEDEIKEK